MSIINKIEGSVRLVNGTATVRYRLLVPKPIVRNNVDLLVDNPMDLQNRVMINVGGAVIVPPKPGPTIEATVGFIATIPTHNTVGQLGKMQRITGTLTSNALDGCKGIIKQTIMVRNVATQVETPFVRSSPVKEISGGVWLHDFPMTVDTGGSPVSGNQINLMKVSYTFTITELPTWSSDHVAFTAPPYVAPPETFSMTNAYLSNGSTVSFTVKSDKAGSTTTVAYRLFENSVVGPSNQKRSGNLTLVNGSGIITYNILTPKPTGGTSNVICLVETPNTARSEITIPKWVEPPYVPPAPPWNPSVTITWGRPSATTASGTMPITITYNGDGNPQSVIIYPSSFLYHSLNGKTMGETTFSETSFIMAPGQSKTINITWTRNNLYADQRTGTLIPFMRFKTLINNAPENWIDIINSNRLSVNY